ncbi:MAG: acyl-CoA reductase [Bacteroidota bacterium]
MTLSERVHAFTQLGEWIKASPKTEKEAWAYRAKMQNPWFTPESVMLALEGVTQYLERSSLETWVEKYDLESVQPKKVGVVMAGNLPLVGFHDFLSVLISGHSILAKLSQKDNVLLPILAEQLLEIEPRFEDSIYFVPQLKEADAFIATGSNNSARYFEHYFSAKPNVIRKNRTAWAVLDSTETEEELLALGNDVFTYFGLGCRNVSKLWLPKGFDFVRLLDTWQAFSSVIDHNKYANNYDYQRGIRLMNQVPIYDSGFLVMEESEANVAPTAMLYYQFYEAKDELSEVFENQDSQIQCIVSRSGEYTRGVKFGQAQSPRLSDYADGVDTLSFLANL